MDGRGGEHAPDIATSTRIQALSDQQLDKIVRDGIPAAGMPGFRSSLGDRQLAEVLRYVRVLQRKGSRASLPGDAARGREIFFGSARCGNCHMVAGEGGFIGADLSTYGTNHEEAEIREAIVKPGKQETVSVTTRAGRKYFGLIRNEDNFSLQIQTPDGNFHFFEKQGLLRVERQPQPLMPETYGTQLAKSELDDLVSYLM